jgi:hypothetical protein
MNLQNKHLIYIISTKQIANCVTTILLWIISALLSRAQRWNKEDEKFRQDIINLEFFICNFNTKIYDGICPLFSFPYLY